MNPAEQLAKAIFDTGGCQEARCKWDERPCCCQDRAATAARDALRGINHLGLSIWPCKPIETPKTVRG